MSVTFYDRDNVARYNADGDQVGGGIEVNFSNGNAMSVLIMMGATDYENPELYGEMVGYDFRKSICRALVTIDMVLSFNRINHDYADYYVEVKRRLERLLTVFSDAENVCWS